MHAGATRTIGFRNRWGLTTSVRRASLPLVALALVLGLSACSGAPKAPDAGGATAAPEPAATSERTGPVSVALLVPLGAGQERIASDARAISNAARMALAEGPAGAVTLNVLDTQGTPDGARGAATRAVAEGAQLIIGPLFATSTEAVASVATAADVPVLSFSTDTRVARPGVWVTGFTPEDEVDRILSFAARNGITRIGVYAPDIPYGRAALDAVAGAAARAGVSVVARESYPRSFQDIERTSPAFAATAVAQGAEAILMPDFSEGLQTAASFMAFHGLSQPEVRYLGTGQWEARATFRERALVGGWFAGADTIATDAFAGRYQARFGERPPFVAVLGYDAARVAVDVAADARAAGRDRPFDDRSLTRESGFAGGVGAIRLRPDGRTERGIAVLEVGSGSFILREPAPARFRAGT